MEMIAQTINLLNGHDVDAQTVPAGEIRSHVLQGLNPGLINASGYSWTGDYVTVTGDLCADLLSNIASEQRAKVVYEYLYRQIDDKKVKETIDFLLNREEAHNAMFWEAFNKVQNSGSNQNFGTITAAKMYFSMSEPSPAGSQFPNAKVTPPSFERDQFRQQDPEDPRDQFRQQALVDLLVRRHLQDLADRQGQLHRRALAAQPDLVHLQDPGDQLDRRLLRGLADPPGL